MADFSCPGINSISGPGPESELELEFLHQLEKYFRSDLLVETQFRVPTRCGEFRLDFRVSDGDRSLGFECDGTDFHGDKAFVRDEFRDALILGEGAVDAIYRLRGPDLWYHPADAFYVIAATDPWLFRRQGAQNLERLASPGARRSIEDGPRSLALFGVACEDGKMHEVEVRRRSIEPCPLASPYLTDVAHWSAHQDVSRLAELIDRWMGDRGFER